MQAKQFYFIAHKTVLFCVQTSQYMFQITEKYRCNVGSSLHFLSLPLLCIFSSPVCKEGHVFSLNFQFSASSLADKKGHGLPHEVLCPCRECRRAADAGADDHADTVGVLFGYGNTGILDRLDTSRHAVMDEDIHMARFLGVEILLDVEAFDFTRKTGGESRRVKSGDVSDPGLSLGDCFPRIGNRIADRGNAAEAGNHYTTVFRTQANLLEWISQAIRPLRVQLRSRSLAARW